MTKDELNDLFESLDDDYRNWERGNIGMSDMVRALHAALHELTYYAVEQPAAEDETPRKFVSVDESIGEDYTATATIERCPNCGLLLVTDMEYDLPKEPAKPERRLQPWCVEEHGHVFEWKNVRGTNTVHKEYVGPVGREEVEHCYEPEADAPSDTCGRGAFYWARCPERLKPTDAPSGEASSCPHCGRQHYCEPTCFGKHEAKEA